MRFLPLFLCVVIGYTVSSIIRWLLGPEIHFWMTIILLIIVMVLCILEVDK